MKMRFFADCICAPEIELMLCCPRRGNGARSVHILATFIQSRECEEYETPPSTAAFKHFNAEVPAEYRVSRPLTSYFDVRGVFPALCVPRINARNSRHRYEASALAATLQIHYAVPMQTSTTSMTAPRTVGILGGMGPAATVDLLDKIVRHTDAARDQDHVPLVIWHAPQIPDRIAALHGGISPEPMLREGARALRAMGAEAIAIACNTAHHWADAVKETSGLPLLHIADAALAEAAAERAKGRSVLLATEATYDLGLYDHAATERGVVLTLPEMATRTEIGHVIRLVKAGDLSSARGCLADALAQLQPAAGDRFILACTELPIAIQGTAFEAKSIDPTLALARAIIRFAMNNKRTLAFGDQVA
jgi:aspartate racemase